MTSEAITLKNPSKIGYTFTGWTGSNGSTPQTSVTIPKGSTGNKSYTANYKANTYTVEYNSNGGSGTTASSTHTYDTAKTLTKNGFTRTGYTFLGWSTNKDATSATYTDSQSVKNLTSTNGGKVTLYAVWKINTYTVNLTVTNGTVSGSTSKSVNYGSSTSFTTVANSPTDRYEITSVSCTNGQSASYSGNNVSISNVTSNTTCTVTYTAKWTGISISSCVAGNTISYAGKNWTVVSKGTDSCNIALNAVSGSGTYDNSTSYLTTNFLNTNATLKSEADNGALVSQNGSYVTTNSNSTVNAPSSYYWVTSGKIYIPEQINKYTITTTPYKTGMSSTGSFPHNNLKVNRTSTKVYSAGATTSLANTASTITFADASTHSVVSSYYYARYYMLFKPLDSCRTPSASILQMQRGAKYAEGTVITETGCVNTYKTWRMYMCGGAYHGKLVTFTAKNATQYSYSHGGSGASATYAYSADKIYYFAGNISASNSGTTTTYNLHNSTLCDKQTEYIADDVTKTINYRPYIIVRTY